MLSYSEYSNIELTILEYASLTIDGDILLESDVNSLIGKAGFKITRSRGIISLLATASKGLGLLMYAAIKGDREQVKELAKSVKREDVLELLLKMDKLTLGLVSAPIGLISEITGWNLQVASATDNKSIVNSIDFIIGKLKTAIAPTHIKRYTSIFNKLKSELS